MTRATGEIHTKIFGHHADSPEAQAMKPRVLTFGIDLTHAMNAMMKNAIANEQSDCHKDNFLKFITEGMRELGDDEEISLS